MSSIPWRGPVSLEWLARCQTEIQPLRPESGAAYLRDAWRVFGLPHRIEAAEAASERFAELRFGETAEAFLTHSDLPRSGRYRELAKQFADKERQASELEKQLAREERQAWIDYFLAREAAEMETKTQLVFGYLRAFGASGHPGAEVEWIAPDACFYLKRDERDDNVLRGENISYWHVRVVDPVRMKSGVSEATPAKRKPTPVNYEAADLLLVQEMHAMLTALPPAATSQWQAAQKVADRAPGHGGVLSKAKRLSQRYSDMLSTEHVGKD